MPFHVRITGAPHSEIAFIYPRDTFSILFETIERALIELVETKE